MHFMQDHTLTLSVFHGGRTLTCVFSRKQLHVRSLCEVNKSIKPQTLVWKAKIAMFTTYNKRKSTKNSKAVLTRVIILNISYSLWIKIHTQNIHTVKIMSHQKSLPQYQGQYKPKVKCVMSTASELYITLYTHKLS